MIKYKNTRGKTEKDYEWLLLLPQSFLESSILFCDWLKYKLRVENISLTG